MLRHITGLGLLGCGVLLSAAYADTVPSYVSAAVASVGRPPEDMSRDEHRKPLQMLVFAGIKPGDKVLELMPGRGYYTRILSKVVGPSGAVYAFVPGTPPSGRPGGPPGAPSAGAAVPPGPPPAAAPANNPVGDVYRLSRSREFGNIMPILSPTMRGSGSIGLPEPVDVVWTSDNYHDFHNKNLGPLDMVAINKAIYRDLKPGGLYIVIDHASAAGAGASQTETLHRIDPATVKQEALAAGFVVDGENDALKNAADDHTKSAFEMHDMTDEFALRFRKPSQAASDKRPSDGEMKLYFGNTLVLGTPTERMRTIFYHADHTYQEFGADGITNGIWFLDADGNNCMVHQTERAGMEGTVACRPMDFPLSKKPKVGDAIANSGGMMSVALLKGYVYPTVPLQAPGGMPTVPAVGAPPPR